jgi:hypothetical protein
MTMTKEPGGTAQAPPPSSSFDFKSCGGTLHALDDGHVPETFSEKGTWIHYPEMEHSPQVHVYDNVLPTNIVHELYQKTVQERQPWGSYVTMDQVTEYWELSPNDEEGSSAHLALTAVACFLKTMTSSQEEMATARIPPHASPLSLDSDNIHNVAPLLLNSNSNIHGVAVWALASNCREVGYHMDYAELIRYEHNILAAPLWAGTLQCTFHTMEGGEFAVNVNGIQHYQQHGYKGNISGDSMGGWSSCRAPTTNKEQVSWEKETGWVTIPYKYNRMIGHSGHLPHLSAPFSCQDYRVIVGFNVFRMDVGPFVEQAPEHSHAFRRRIQCHRVLNNNSGMSLANIRQNKTLTKLLVLAKREKVKQELRKAQEVLDKELEHSVTRNGTSVQTLINNLAQAEDGVWPCAVDVQVHIQLRVHDGIFTCNHVKVTPESIVYKR